MNAVSSLSTMSPKATLPPAERRLVQTIYFEGATLQEAANRIGISKSWASRLHAGLLVRAHGPDGEARLRQLLQAGAPDQRAQFDRTIPTIS